MKLEPKKDMFFINHQQVRWIGLQFAIFCFFFGLVCLNYNFYLTNQFTPGGDGNRIYPYLQYMDKVPEIFPFWHAHKFHGYPTMADPENLMPFGVILNTESPYFNIQLNLIFFFLAATIAFSCRSIARLLGMSQVASLVVGGGIVLCVPIARWLMHGTISFLFDNALMYVAILLLLVCVNSNKNKYIYLVIPATVLLSWAIRSGYYFPIYFHFPAFVFLVCLYQKKKISLPVAICKTILLLSLITILLIFFSAPFLLPILDGILLSKTFITETPTIKITDRWVYDYYFSLWPFIVLSLVFACGLFRRFAFLFFSIAIINYFLIFFDLLQIDAFFDFWKSIPIIKNIRHQHVFQDLSSIAAAFCFGIFIDSSKNKLKIENYWLYCAISFTLISLFSCIAYKQYIRGLPMFMSVISIIFALMVLSRNKFSVNIALSLVVMLLMGYHFNVSPVEGKFYKTKNNESINNYDGPYVWFRSYGYDKYNAHHSYALFSMVFMQEYRTLLSLLHGQEVSVQRPHWVMSKGIEGSIKFDKEKFNLKIAQLMAIHKPNFESNVTYTPFRIYDRWIVEDEEKTIEMMGKEDFSLNDPIILEKFPNLTIESDATLKTFVELTGKTAETLSLYVETNKNSIVLVPEIYHRDWNVTVDGEKTSVIKAYASMRAVAVSPGEHTIIMRFVYRPFYWGGAIFCITFAILLVVLFFFKDIIYKKIAPVAELPWTQ